MNLDPNLNLRLVLDHFYFILTGLTSYRPESVIQGYIHHHAWLLFAAQALATRDVIHSNTHYPDLDYVKLAAQLQSQCIDAVSHCLQQIIPDDAEGRLLLKMVIRISLLFGIYTMHILDFFSL